MSSWFAGIGQAASGLSAARYGLTVVGQNMANSSTVGYTRQTAQQTAVDMGVVSGLTTGAGSMGGVTISATTRSTDALLDARTRSEHGRGALADTSASQLASVEAALGEPSDDGLAAQLNDFWKSWGTVANSPQSTPARTALLSAAGTVATTLNSQSQSLAEITAGTAAGLSDDVDAVNAAATKLGTLNGAIAVGAASGGNVNSLLDERDQLLDTLSTLTGATATLEQNGTATVSLGGQPLVSGTTVATMTSDASYGLAVDGQPVALTSGRISARVTALTTTLPGYAATLDAVADALSAKVNAAQAGGYDLNGTAGTAMFSGSGAGGITLALADPALVAASGVPGGGRDNSVAITLSQAGAAPGAPDAIFGALVGNVASTSAAAKQRSATQSAVVSYVDGLKTSVSGVSIDEEAAQMLVYQQAFNASSRVLTAIDSMLDTLINHTGLVGRG